MASSQNTSQPLPDDGQSSASDDDRNAVEVSFDETNPYRRKSSLVKDDVPPHLRKVDCIVHQFLEGQKPVRHHHQQQPNSHKHTRNHRARTHSHLHPVSRRPGVISVSPEPGFDRPADSKGQSTSEEGSGSSGSKDTTRPRCSLVTGSSLSDDDGDDAGQMDQKEWRGVMTSPVTQSQPQKQTQTQQQRTPSDLDRLVAGENSAVHSRLLTKKQLGEMAWGVRELSRRLGSIRLRFRVKTIFLLVKIYDPDMVVKARELVGWLLDEAARGTRYTVYVEEGLRANRGFDLDGLAAGISGGQDPERKKEVSRRVRVWDEQMCRTRPHTFDFVITLGGDGTVLYASWLFQRIVPPVLSFALGSLGFLTKFDFSDFKRTLGGAFNEGVSVSLRLRFEGTVMRSQRIKAVKAGDEKGADVEEEDQLQRSRDLVNELIGEEKDDERTHRPDGTYEVLNEVVVERGPNPTMSELEIFGDDEHFTTVMADGVCVSTPTGSTAYNLAAGGSLCHPDNPVMLLTAISPHTLSFRPIILPDTIILRLGVPFEARTSSWASFDGRERVELRPGDYVTVSASRYPFASVQLHNRRSEEWIDSISAKLAWNSRSRQKAYKEWEK